jgi:hypothetical protein
MAAPAPAWDVHGAARIRVDGVGREGPLLGDANIGWGNRCHASVRYVAVQL